MAVLKSSVSINSFKSDQTTLVNDDDYTLLAFQSFVNNLIKPTLCIVSVAVAILIGMMMPVLAQAFQLGF